MIRVEILEQTRAALKPFVMLPFSLYKDEPNWVPPLIDDQLNALCEKTEEERRFFLVYDENKPVARVMAQVDARLNARLGRKCGGLALFECAPRPDYARTALDAACAYLKEAGMEMVMGPISAAKDDLCKGLLVQGFDGPPVLFNPYNPPYYGQYFEKCGFKKHRDHFAYFLRMEEFDLDLVEDVVPRAMKRFGFRVEHVCFTPANEKKLLRDIRRVITEAFPDQWEMAVPSEADVQKAYQVMRRYYRPEMTVMAYAGDRPIGFVTALPDYNQALKKMKGRTLPLGWLKFLLAKGKIDGARCNMQFVVPEYQRMGVNTALFYEAFQGAKKLGIRWVEGSTVDETNAASIASTEKAGSHLYRIYRQYEKTL